MKSNQLIYYNLLLIIIVKNVKMKQNHKSNPFIGLLQVSISYTDRSMGMFMRPFPVSLDPQ